MLKTLRRGPAYLLIAIAFASLAFVKNDKGPLLVVKTKLDYLNVDNMGNLYAVKEDELMKFLATGKFFARYSNLKLGTITSIDVTNPLKILLYYRDFQQIVFLDNQLSVNSEIVSLEKLGFEQTDLVCAGANNSFWIYNKQNNELLRFNENSKKIASTGNLKQVLQADLAPNFMIEHNGYLFLNSPETGIYVFDMFGAFSKIIAIRKLKQFQVVENALYYANDSAFCSYNHKIFDEACKPLPYLKELKGLKYFNKNLYLDLRDSILVLPFK